MTGLTVAVGVILDLLFGEPKRGHPLIGFGAFASRLEKRLNRSPEARAAVGRGAAAWCLAVLPPVVAVVCLQYWLTSGLSLVVDCLLVYFCIAYRSLREHLNAVHEPLIKGDIRGARRAIGRIVSRDCEDMSEADISKAAAESTLENGSDGIFASIFWFVVAGAPGVLLHRLANTLDAMWGYKNARFLGFGKFAARTDDILNWLPARLVALSYALLGDRAQALRAWRTQAKACASPNGGPVMAAGAAALNLRVGGDAFYQWQRQQRPTLGFGLPPGTDDLPKVQRLIDQTLALWLVLVCAASFILWKL